MSKLDMREIINLAIFHQKKLDGILQRVRGYDTAIALVRQVSESLKLNQEAVTIHSQLVEERAMLMKEFMAILLGEEEDLV